MKPRIYALFGAAASGKDELFRQAEKLAPGRVIRVALGDEIKRQADQEFRGLYGISAWTEDRQEKEIIRPYLETYGEQHGLELLPDVIVTAQLAAEAGTVVMVPRVQNAAEMRRWVRGGALPVWVSRDGVEPATEREQADILGIRSYCTDSGIEIVGCHAVDLDDVRANARHLLQRAGVR